MDANTAQAIADIALAVIVLAFIGMGCFLAWLNR